MKVQMKVMGVTYSQLQQGAYILMLTEDGGTRRVPVVIGTAEAQSIAIRMENLTPPRPMTHDLMIDTMSRFGISCKEIYIYKFDKGIFYSSITLFNGDIDVEVCSRTSDAVALALRTDSPIFMDEEVLQQAGFESSQFESVASDKAEDNDYEKMSDAELEARKKQAVAIEAYEEAALIQQILQKRK